jgi:hypothetical protein
MYHDYNEHSSLEIGVFTSSANELGHHLVSHASVVFLFFRDCPFLYDESWNLLVNPP